MENLVKEVEALRTHIRFRNTVSGIVAVLLILNSILYIIDSDNIAGGRLFHLYFIGLLILILFYIYKNRTRLPFPGEITKETLEDYQRKQLKRYIFSSNSMIWWFYIPFVTITLGFFLVEQTFSGVTLLKLIGVTLFIITVYLSNKHWIEKYTKQYEKLGGDPIEFWFHF